jgi:hypothetical protein
LVPKTERMEPFDLSDLVPKTERIDISNGKSKATQRLGQWQNR